MQARTRRRHRGEQLDDGWSHAAHPIVEVAVVALLVLLLVAVVGLGAASGS